MNRERRDIVESLAKNNWERLFEENGFIPVALECGELYVPNIQARKFITQKGYPYFEEDDVKLLRHSTTDDPMFKCGDNGFDLVDFYSLTSFKTYMYVGQAQARFPKFNREIFLAGESYVCFDFGHMERYFLKQINT